MITEQQIQLVKATAPLLKQTGETLTQHFYSIMLSEYPQVRPLFNQANQASGDQPRALANAVINYAMFIDRLDQITGVVKQVIHKHAALQILPEHYPIVGACLLRAIRDVLGEGVATDEVIAAWAAAYQQLADILIGAEEEIYRANQTAPGGWRGGRTFVVQRKQHESREICSFYLHPKDGGPVLKHACGQYLGIRLMVNGQDVRRNYSISNSPDGEHYRISVKREPGGVVSNYLHDQIEVGAELEIFPPAGEFGLDESTLPLVFITAGVGITPSISMVEKAKSSGRDITFIHFARNAAVHAFKDWLAQVSLTAPGMRSYVCYSEPEAGDQADATGVATGDLLRQWAPNLADSQVYFLGPKPFMKAVYALLRELRVPEEKINFEFFGPASALI
ncbi:NO-inducible flavohemoprotein [Aquipseudomonas guryensis]|uniref:Flavohemoprotein n=1 Tax=Aquipseudomonas guryensis TaxID=2759165 RepID=A0A7W4H4R8_9GAMM|nr:NO-inducible flavohemoprotein [Pseudomonas guryensis]MBB1521003.1 NO-inducible flavohemoprotein [Pseudomonas guryensis]